MYKLLGVLLLVSGSLGFAVCLCREAGARLMLQKEMKALYELLQEEIRYSGLPLPELFGSMGKRLRPPLAGALLRVGEALEREQGESLTELWEKEMQAALSSITLKEQQKRLLLQLPELLGISDREGQAKAFERQIRELELLIRQGEQDEKNKNKVIMSLGLAAGIFLAIVLL